MAKRPDDRYATAVELGAAAVAAARHATGRSWGGDPTIDIPRQQTAPPTDVAPPWAGAGRSGPERAAGWSGPQRSAAPPTTVPPAAAAVSGLAGAPTVAPAAAAPPAAAPPTVQGFPGGDGHPSGPSLRPDSVPGPQWGGGQWAAGQWGGEHGNGQWNGGQWNAHPAWPPAAQQWGAQPFAGGGSGGHAPPGPPSYPSGPLSAPRPRNNTRTVALMLTAVLVLAGVATAAVLLLRPPGGGGGGGVVADPTTAATPSRPVGTIAGAPIAVGKEPRDIEAGEGYVWTANTDGTISKVDPAAGTAEQITVGGVPAELTVAEGGVWVWNYSDAVIRVDVATGEVSDPISANGTGNITGTAVGGGFLWLSHSSSNSVSRIDLATRQATGTPTTVGAAPVSMAYGDRVLYVSNTGEKTLSVLDGATGAAGNPIILEEAPAGVAVKDGTIFVGTTGDVTPIDEASSVIGDPIPLKGGSYFLADSGGIWVTFPLTDELHWFDLSGQEPHGDAITGVGKGVGDMVLLDDGVWVSDTAENSVVHVQVAR